MINNMSMKRWLMMGCLWSVGALSAMAQSYNELVEQAMACIRTDSLVQAEQLFREALKLDPNNARNALLFSNLGTVLNRQGRVDEAIASYTMGLNIIPYSTAMLLNRAALYMQTNQWEQAFVDYCNVIDLLPDDPEARVMRAYIHLLHRRYDEARIDYNVVLAQDGKNKTARLGMVMLDEKERRYVAATEGLTLLIHDYPEDASLLKMRANIALEQGHPEVALLDLEEAVRVDDRDADTYLQMGDLYLETGHKSEAQAAYEQAIRLGIPRPQLAKQLRQCR